MDRKPLSFFDELFPYSPWRRPSPLEIEALGGNGMVDIESLSNQNGEEISSFSKLSANSVENISTDSNKLKKLKTKLLLTKKTWVLKFLEAPKMSNICQIKMARIFHWRNLYQIRWQIFHQMP